MKKKLLIHYCCGPCGFKFKQYFNENYELIGFWCNPNIQPIEEYEKRKDSFVKLHKKQSIAYIETYPEKFSQWIYSVKKALKDGVDRCTACYTMRLQEAYQKMIELKLDFFTTTLLASPYQKHDLIKEIGIMTGGAHFVYNDFRTSYYAGRNTARAEGFYIQNYCGCLLSLEERRINDRSVQTLTLKKQ
ncbi:MAG: epoxyqueuosine reductase QueH [bacterium]